MREDIARFVERTRKEQGLPVHVEDPVILARVAALLGPPSKSAGLARVLMDARKRERGASDG